MRLLDLFRKNMLKINNKKIPPEKGVRGFL